MATESILGLPDIPKNKKRVCLGSRTYTYTLSLESSTINVPQKSSFRRFPRAFSDGYLIQNS